MVLAFGRLARNGFCWIGVVLVVRNLRGWISFSGRIFPNCSKNFFYLSFVVFSKDLLILIIYKSTTIDIITNFYSIKNLFLFIVIEMPVVRTCGGGPFWPSPPFPPRDHAW